MMVVNESLVKKAVVTMEMQEYLELLQDATMQGEFIKQLKKDIGAVVSDGGYVSVKTTTPGLSYYHDLIRTSILMDLINNPETVEALYLREYKFFDLCDMTFTGYKWYDDGTNIKFNILEDDAVKEHWAYAMQITKVIGLVEGMGPDQLGELCVQITDYIQDEQIPEERKAEARRVLAKLPQQLGIERGDAKWLVNFGFIELPEVEVEK